MADYILEMTGVSKKFPGVQALDHVSLRVRPGTVHALTGENGAGKSTLMKCLLGLYQMDEGKILIDGEEVRIANPIDAANHGISMIHQELSPISERSVAENLFVGRIPQKHHLFTDNKKLYEDAKRVLDNLNINIDPHDKMKTHTIAEMQMIEIAKAVSRNSSIIIMDEPTSSLSTREIKQLFRIIKDLKQKGAAIIFISHKMDEIYSICDEITVLRDGKFISTDKIADLDSKTLIQRMVGRELISLYPKVHCPITDTIMEVKNLSSGNSFSGISFTLRKGEILGFSGLVGAGRTEVLETIFGLRKKTDGEIIINGEVANIENPAQAMKYGLAFLTEDRRKSGIIPMSSVADNIVIANLKNYLSKFLFLDRKAIKKDAGQYVKRINIKTPSINTRTASLSGGNQQKVLIARWLATTPDILLIDEPTRGIDVGAKAEIYSLIYKMAAEGKAIILVSSELPEILSVADRILVMHEGRQTAIVDREEATQEIIMSYSIA